jgi:Tfp pilus assembly PilM family ATPase
MAVLGITHNWSEISIVRQRKVVLTRSIARVEEEDAGVEADAGPRLGSEPFKLGDEIPDLEPAYLGRVAREANKTLDYFEIELLSPAVERLLLTGRGACVDELAPLVGDELQLNCSPLDTEGKVEDDTGEYDPRLHGLAVGAAIGEEAFSED